METHRASRAGPDEAARRVGSHSAPYAEAAWPVAGALPPIAEGTGPGLPRGTPRRRTSRAIARALQGVVLAAGAPLGWFLIQLLSGAPAADTIADQPALYLYMLLGAAAAFGSFGFLLGRREERLLESNLRLEELAVTDPLTGLRNARYFRTRLEEEWAESERTGNPLSVVEIDLDHFKRINDRHGHAMGDAVLIGAARAIASITRQGETAARVGGEEFALLLPNSTAEEASEVAERVRAEVAATRTPLPGNPRKRVRVTASAGVACTADLPRADVKELFRSADRALYRAKREGRNRTVVAEPPHEAS